MDVTHSTCELFARLAIQPAKTDKLQDILTYFHNLLHKVLNLTADIHL